MQILLICIQIYPKTYCSFSPPNKMLTIKHLILFYFLPDPKVGTSLLKRSLSRRDLMLDKSNVAIMLCKDVFCYILPKVTHLLSLMLNVGYLLVYNWGVPAAPNT